MPASTSPRPAPLVEPAPDLTEEQVARADRQMRLPGFGAIAQRRLAAAKVLVVGAGGLGSACIPYLVGAGVGAIGVVDDDRVELSNLHRQIAHRTADVGRAKADSMAETAAGIDPGVRIVTHRLRLTSQNALDVLAPYDLVIDGSDNFPTRYLVNDAAEMLDMPLVWGAILQYHGQVGVAWHRHGPGYRDLFPQPPAPEDVLSCEAGGVLPGLCGTIGSLLATEAMKIITGVGDPLIGRVLLYDALASRTRELPYRRDPDGASATELIDYELFCAGPPPPPEVAAAELAGMLRSGARPRIIDVRDPEERATQRIVGSEALPLPLLEAGDATLEGATLESEVLVYCQRDPRSIRAARLLMDRGIERVAFLRGGIEEFSAVAPEFVESGSESGG
jgi:adenylyltransferase/sulfurtransferase